MGFLPFFSVETWILLVTFICLFVVYGYSSYGIVEKLGVPVTKPRMYFGTIGRHHKVYYLDDCFQAKKNGRIWGGYEFKRPTLSVMEPEMLKTILVKECFTYFTNRRNLLLNGELYDAVNIAEDDHWRRLRNILSPYFTSGRQKEMFSHMTHHANKLTACLQPKAQNEEVIVLKDFFGGYSLDTMASCTFSVDLDTIHKPRSPIINHASNLFRLSVPLFMLQACFPALVPLLKMMGVSFFPKATISFFKKFIEMIREERGGSSRKISGDFLQNMIDSQTDDDPKIGKENKALTDHEITSQVTMLVFAGHETSSTTLVFVAYCLARNPEAMKRLQEEIDSTFPNKSPVQYESLMQMEYLDSVVSETLRLYPPAPRLERVAKETVKINGIKIPKDILLQVPVYALHRDPELWPEPEEFRPDRFSKENRQNITPYSYLPFGAGPRNCIGMRFALLTVKVALVKVLQNYSFKVCDETEFPLEMDYRGLIGPLKPIKLRVVTRSNN